jgi:hypothetical protein
VEGRTVAGLAPTPPATEARGRLEPLADSLLSRPPCFSPPNSSPNRQRKRHNSGECLERHWAEKPFKSTTLDGPTNDRKTALDGDHGMASFTSQGNARPSPLPSLLEDPDQNVADFFPHSFINPAKPLL